MAPKAAKGKPAAEKPAKGKPAAEKAGKGKPAAEKAGKGKAAKTPEKEAELSKKIAIGCGILALLSFILISVMTAKYLELLGARRAYDQPFRELRSSLATAVNDPEFLNNKYNDVAREIDVLPYKTETAREVFKQRKQQYRSLFYQTARGSTGPWKFYGKSLYYFSKGEKSWYDAENYCVSRDAHLASILSEEEQNFIASELRQASWIGLTNGKTKGTWIWTDGSRFGSPYWSDGQPRYKELMEETNQDCALMVPSSTQYNWHDDYCHRLYKWVCKESLDLGEL